MGFSEWLSRIGEEQLRSWIGAETMEEEKQRRAEARRRRAEAQRRKGEIAEIKGLGLSPRLLDRVGYCAEHSGLTRKEFVTQAVARAIDMAEKRNPRHTKKREAARDTSNADMAKSEELGLSAQIIERVDICAERAGLSRKEFVINAVVSATDAAEIRIARLERLQR